jgi:DNA repair protein RadC
MLVRTAADAAALFEPLFAGAEQERLCIAYLDRESRLIGHETFEQGAAQQVDLPVRAIATSALRLGAEALVIAHNHPSGNAEPSVADREATRRLADTLRALGIRLQDHLVYAAGEWRSFRGLGLL